MPFSHTYKKKCEYTHPDTYINMCVCIYKNYLVVFFFNYIYPFLSKKDGFNKHSNLISFSSLKDKRMCES